MSSGEVCKAFTNCRPLKPLRDTIRPQLDKHPFPTILDCRKPRRLQGKIRSLDIRIVLAVDVGHYRFEPRESDKGYDLTRSVKLDHGLDTTPMIALAPYPIREPACVEILVDGYIISKPLRRGQQGVKLNLLDRALARGTAPALTDCGKELLVAMKRQPIGQPWLSLEEGEISCDLDNLEIIPELPHGLLQHRTTVGEGEDAHHLREIRVCSRTGEQSARLPTLFGCTTSQPRTFTRTTPKWVELKDLRFVEPAGLAAFAANRKVNKVSRSASFVHP